MNVAELPMILFTVIAQMCVGAFLVLGVVQTLGSLRFSAKAIDQVADPALLAIGPAMVFGLAVSMFHMHDVTNTFNVIRHAGSSWLSREILFGTGFAALGFLFAVVQLLKWGRPRLRQALAVLTALVGVGLVFSMSMIYYSLVTVPAWHSWFVPLQFFATTVILGSLAIGTAFVITTSVQARQVARGVTASAADSGRRVSLRQRFTTPADPAVRDEVEALLAVSVRGIVVTAFVASAALLVAIPLYLSGLTAIGGVALQSVEVYSGALFVARLGLLALGAGLLAVFTYFIAAKPRENLGRLVVVLTTSLVLVFIAEVLGRALFYESMFRVGV